MNMTSCYLTTKYIGIVHHIRRNIQYKWDHKSNQRREDHIEQLEMNKNPKPTRNVDFGNKEVSDYRFKINFLQPRLIILILLQEEPAYIELYRCINSQIHKQINDFTFFLWSGCILETKHQKPRRRLSRKACTVAPLGMKKKN